MDRGTKLFFLLLTCPLLACADDVPEVPEPETTSGGSTTGSITTVNPMTMTVSDTDSTTMDSTATSGVDSTGTTEGPATTEATDDSGTTGGTDTTEGVVTEGTDTGSTGPTSTTGEPTSTTGGEMCGNDMIEGAEECDGAELDGETCASQGFVDGVLACAPDCTFDTSGCNACGNAVVDAGEDCDGADLGGNTCAGLGMGFTGGVLGCDAACAYDTAGCTNVPWPVAGEVVITEIMQNPAVLADAEGEWFELYNPTMTNYQLGSCVIEGSMADAGFTVDIDLEIGPLEYRIFATDSAMDQGFVADYQWLDADFGLNNSTDTVRLVCDGVIVDEVTYDDGATFPDPSGESMNLDPMTYDAISNDDGTNWCEATSSYNGDLGTPGADNDPCVAGMVYSIDFCRLQFPEIVDEVEGTDVDAFGRLFIGGLTDLSGVNDPAPEVIGYIGYGPDGTDPAVDPGWVWTAGVPNPGYGPASPNYEANNDEYQAVLSVPSPPGDYDFAFRFSGDSGATFTYCDGQPAGSSDGYQVGNAGQMTSQPAPAAPPMYFSEYAEGSSSNKAVEIYNPPGMDADLTACEIRFYFNGGVVPGNTIALAGVLPADDVLVVCDDSIDPLIFDPMNCDVLAGGSFYNGDDAIELACAGVTLDVIGQIGFDPGAEWVNMGVGTQNETIRRDCAVVAGDTNGADAFDPAIEWASFAQDDFSDFGQYVCP